MSARAYTEDQQAAHPHPASPTGRGGEQPATKGKAEGGRLKAEELPPEAIASAIDELTRDLLLPRLLSGQVELALDEKDRHPPAAR